MSTNEWRTAKIAREKYYIYRLMISKKDISLSKTALYRAWGNAVPPVLMWEVTNSVIKAIKKVENLEQKTPKYQQLELDLVR